jgi:hypothetical protein
MAKLSKKALEKYEASRDLGEELLAAAREISAGKAARVHVRLIGRRKRVSKRRVAERRKSAAGQARPRHLSNIRHRPNEPVRFAISRC